MVFLKLLYRPLEVQIQSSAWAKIEKHAIMKVLQNALDNNIDTIKTENLYVFDGKPAFSLGQGQ